MAPLVWLVTGTTSGIGAALVDHIIARGDRVIASGRKAEQRLGHLKSDNIAVLELDIAAGRAEIDTQVKKAWNIFGHIDVLVNNAGMSAMKSAEEADDAFINNMFQVNLFGHMHVTQAILPFLRAQGHGCIGFTSSSTAWAPLPFMSHYAASKAALSVYVESLHKEVRPLGIQCVAFECGGFPTHLGQPRDAGEAGFGSAGPAVAAYGPLFGELVGMFAADPMAHMPGDLAKAATAVVDIIKREGMAAGRPWAVRVALGSDGMGSVRQKCEEQLKLVDGWKDVSYSTDRDGQRVVTSKEMLKFTSILETEA
ncbi:hypothetical protein FGG08_003196 [Glutinoglossum americanum]|uniref:Uncharacterized protein n=1 Tax=Glutinoglossum americanum TaxID=1670608 RepID=A0A9P8IA97_9PEZI|nr:hypothetical protein FGG08_003196 [Glutinoglossum americanum]